MGIFHWTLDATASVNANVYMTLWWDCEEDEICGCWLNAFGLDMRMWIAPARPLMIIYFCVLAYFPVCVQKIGFDWALVFVQDSCVVATAQMAFLIAEQTHKCTFSIVDFLFPSNIHYIDKLFSIIVTFEWEYWLDRWEIWNMTLWRYSCKWWYGQFFFFISLLSARKRIRLCASLCLSWHRKQTPRVFNTMLLVMPSLVASTIISIGMRPNYWS